ncbi:MAG TPA: PilZ domain-containing protein [Deltaproteobacteria bacterium]|nr:PilZ domain-containing protein [Deltaproteobacteria bacterium]
MAQSTDGAERRRHKRKRIELMALIKVGIIHQGRGHTKDISLNGIWVENRTIFAHMRPNRIPELINTQIKISFPQESLTVMGKIVRIDHAKGDIALEVVQTTNDETWKKICGEES